MTFNMSSIDWNMSTTLESSAHLATATSSINTSENGEWYASSIYLNDSDYTAVIFGDGSSGSNYFPSFSSFYRFCFSK